MVPDNKRTFWPSRQQLQRIRNLVRAGVNLLSRTGNAVATTAQDGPVAHALSARRDAALRCILLEMEQPSRLPLPAEMPLLLEDQGHASRLPQRPARLQRRSYALAK